MIPRTTLLNLSRSATLQQPSRSISSTPTRLSDTDSKGPNPRNQQSQSSQKPQPSDSDHHRGDNQPNKPHQQKKKTVAQADAELRDRLEQMSGEGGAAGIEYEDGQPNTMKRSVRNNMFRYI